MEAAIFLSHKILVGLTEKIDRVWEWGEKYLKDCRKHLTLVDNYNSVFFFSKSRLWSGLHTNTLTRSQYYQAKVYLIELKKA